MLLKALNENSRNQSKPGFFFFFLINHYSLIIVADCIYPSRGRHYEWFECPWIFHQLDLTDGWIIMCRYSLYNTSLPPD